MFFNREMYNLCGHLQGFKRLCLNLFSGFQHCMLCVDKMGVE